MTDDELRADGAGESASAPRHIQDALSTIERAQFIRRVLIFVGIIALLALTGIGMTYLGFTVAQIYRQLPQFLNNVAEFLSPDFHYFTLFAIQNDLHGFTALFESLLTPGSLLDAVLNRDQGLSIIGGAVATIVIGFTGTVIGFPLALIFGVLGSERVTPFPFNFLFRGTMSVIRAVPALVWVLIYIPLVGITPVGAMLAIGTDTIGNLGRLFTDELEEVSDGPIEAISSTGAASSQTVVFGMLSQVSSSFVAWTLYILEINVRIAVSLGVVGAGGIGQYVKGRLSLLAYDQAAAGIAMIIVIVLSVELTSSRLRARLRPGETESKGIVDALLDLADTGKWLGTGNRK
ncbi:PhnE/PtxC family ABC transporter permease [Haloferax larsenii]|uniref:Phosphate/phosphonate ABC transporter permease n=1 Tax=Haloferax larsenii TaxID=302484 RepID=A0A1H7FLT5_HALLR|nr:phosphate/phosphonate ABC transporter permease [Haloferax larsenii]ELZ75170.1 ABC-type phosphate/phosphonate/phosphite transport system, permease protein [Haloferax larsenii JCM 13917]UVE51582.1 phosphate/phosphonate ABC transporter permease [Haloferax larsenii]SEK27046.1 phosphonate transport system permease protein [Haloferax larsenii]